MNKKPDETALEYREIYCPAHFGNTYEVMGNTEAEELLTDARAWGFNAYGDWFDTADLQHPAGGRGHFLLPQAILERKLATFAIADRLGFRTDQCITPNHVWLDQLRPDLRADDGGQPGHIFGQLLCPSRPEARQIILDNHEYLFRQLQDAGVRLASFSACPYDYGGCACAACNPWMVTFGRLCRDIHAVGRKYFPELEARLVGWWWTAEEHRIFQAWADAETPGLFRALARHIPYNHTAPDAGLVLPAGCAAHAFVHVGYPDRREDPGADIYGTWGPVVGANRLPATVDQLRREGAGGFTAYTEGAFDDVNRAILAGLGSGQFATCGAVLEAYAERHFGAPGAARRDWADWLAAWSTPLAVAVGPARVQFEALSRNATRGWRLAQWEQKLRMFEAHHEVMSRTAWDDRRRAAAERFVREQERLYRQVWGLGLVRHVLNPRFFRPAWHAEWQQTAHAPGGVGSAEAQA